MRDIFIIGAGGVGKEVAFLIEEINKKNLIWNIVGFIDDNNEIKNSYINGYKVLGNIEYLKRNFNKANVIIAIADYRIKKNISEQLKNDFEFATLIHPDVNIHHTVKIGGGSIIYPGVIITTNICIGNHVIISPKCGIGHDAIINDYTSLLWNVNISGHNKIGTGCLIGSGATIIQNKVVGDFSIIGAGSVVIKDIKDCTINVGVPTREVKNEKGIICNNS